MPASKVLFREDYSGALPFGSGYLPGAEEFFKQIDFSPLRVHEQGAASLSVLRLAGLTQLRFASPSVSFAWHRRRGAAKDRRAFILIDSGSVAVSVGGDRLVATPNTVVSIRPGAAPVDFVLAAGITQGYMLSVDQHLLDRSSASGTARLESFLCPHASLHASLSGMLRATMLTEVGRSGAVAASGLHTLLLAACNALDLYSSGSRASEVLDVYKAAMAVIEVGSTDPRTTPKSIAASLGVSLRTLQRCFAERGGSPARELRLARVQTAKALLAKHPAMPVTLVASKAGFPDAGALRRQLKSEGAASIAE